MFGRTYKSAPTTQSAALFCLYNSIGDPILPWRFVESFFNSLKITMNTNPYPIYVISLKRTPERRLYIQRQLDALNLNYQFVDAIDKRDLKSPQYRAEIADLLGIDRTIVEKRNTHYFYDHFACALSHVKVYNLMAKHNDSAACILEDDARIAADFPEILRATMKTSWDILMLSSQSKTIRYIPATNPNIQREMREMPEIDCSLFPKLRKSQMV